LDQEQCQLQAQSAPEWPNTRFDLAPASYARLKAHQPDRGVAPGGDFRLAQAAGIQLPDKGQQTGQLDRKGKYGLLFDLPPARLGAENDMLLATDGHNGHLWLGQK